MQRIPRLLFPVLSTVAMLAIASAAGAGAVPPPELPVCRDAGFWQTHSAAEKTAPNITQAVIDEAGGCLSVCGEIIDETTVDSADSALEALCVSPKAGPQIQLARQLLAAQLSCVFSTGNPLCLEGSSYCEEACADGVSDSDDALCMSYLTCTLAGGTWPGPGLCILGSCSTSGSLCGTGLPACPLGETCVPFEGNCAQAPLVNGELDYDPTPPASSPKACNSANKTSCAVVGPKEETCASGEVSAAPEACECADASCGSPAVCNEAEECYAYQTPEEQCGVCSYSTYCSSPACTASSDCAAGQVCIINTCCGAGGVCTNVCTPDP